MKRLPLYLFAGCLTVGLLVLSFMLFNAAKQDPLYRPGASDKSLAELYTEGQSAQKTHLTEQKSSTVRFLAVGDISLSRSVATAIQEKKDPLYPFAGVEELLRSTDFNFGNLESPFSSRETFNPGPSLVFNAPKTNVAGLAAYNFLVLNLANNHAFDQGLDGITTTKKVLDDSDIQYMGTGKDLDEAWAPAIIEKNGIKIGFIGASYASSNDGGKTTNNYVARIEDLSRLTSGILRLKPLVDFIVVTMHAGTEYTPTANAAQVTFAHAAVDAGADIVIGAHPHWVQNKEIYNGKTIYYSLGNFIFDQSWSEQTKKGLALKITISKDGQLGSSQSTANGALPNAATAQDLQGSKTPATLDSIEEIPVYIEQNCCPTIIKDDLNKK